MGWTDFFTTYKANKMVAIKSRNLGILYRLIQLLFVLYILVWVICIQNKHLLPVAMDGSIRLTVQQPTQSCNPMHVDCKSDYMKMSALPYCKQYSGATEGKPTSFVPWSSAIKANASRLKEHKMQHHCVYKDNINLTFANPIPGTLFLQTRVSELPQYQQCIPTAENGWSCDGALYQMEQSESQTNYFVADIERFTILLDHSFRVTVPNVRKPLHGHGTHYDGYVQKTCGRLLKIPHKPHSSDYDSLFSIPIGTIVSLADLLKMADARGDKLLDEIDPHADNKTRRWNGGVLHISISYSSENQGPQNFLGNGKISYVVGVSLLPQQEFKNMHASEVSGSQRLVLDDHGFLIVASVHGTLYVFDFVYLTQVLTTSVALFAVASMIVDFLMNHLVAHRYHYNLLQYQHTVDFDTFGEEKGVQELLCTSRDDSSSPLIKLSHLEAKCKHQEFDLQGEDLLYVLLKMEQRLNSLDGLDPNFVCGNDRSIKETTRSFLEKHERTHRVTYASSDGSASVC